MLSSAADHRLFDLPTPHVPVAGGGLFPVRRIYCVGQNYAAHAREMGVDPTRQSPVFFQKPADAVQPVPDDEIGAHAYPPLTEDYHPEVELVVALKSGGRDIPAADGIAHVFGYAVGLDMTRRDRQRELKAGGKPWEVAKAFDHSAPIGPIVPATDPLAQGAITLAVNGDVRQRGDLADLIWNVPALIAELSRGVELKTGDLIFTGTPAGVGPVVRGDELSAHIDGLPDLRIKIV